MLANRQAKEVVEELVEAFANIAALMHQLSASLSAPTNDNEVAPLTFDDKQLIAWGDESPNA